MHLSGRSIVPALLAVVATGCADGTPVGPRPTVAPRAAAGQQSGIVTEVTPFTFTFPAGSCGLTTEVTVVGELREMTHTTVIAGETYPIAFHETAHGTATGADGSRYVFNYVGNRRRVDFTGARPFEVRWVDHFHLVGQGTTPDVRTFFNTYFRANADGSRTTYRDVVLGNPGECDPL
jgi:hypothetical protein